MIYQLWKDYTKAKGFKNFISSVNYKKQSIIKYFQCKVLKVNLTYIKEKIDL